jgi:hypothetical protein
VIEDVVDGLVLVEFALVLMRMMTMLLVLMMRMMVEYLHIHQFNYFCIHMDIEN